MMPFFRFLFSIVVTVLVASGCASFGDSIKRQVDDMPESARGYIIGKYAISCDPKGADCQQAFNSHQVWYRSKNDSGLRGIMSSVRGSMFGSDTKFDFVDPAREEKGFYFCIPLVPDTYAFYSFRLWNFAGGGSGFTVNREAEFDLPFTASAADIAYLGKIKLTTTEGRNLFGMKMPGPGVLLLSEGDQSDVQKALAKCPDSVRNRPVRPAVLKASMAGGSVLVFDEYPDSR